MDPNRFHDQAVTALGQHPDDWHCPECWSWASDLTSPQDVARLRALGRTFISSGEYEMRRGGTCDRCKKAISESDTLVRKRPDHRVAAEY